MSTRTHPWMPTSPCTHGCLPVAPRTVTRLTRLVRWCTLASIVLALPLFAVVALLPGRFRAAVLGHASRTVLRCVGVRVDVTDLRDRRGYGGGMLVVAPHVSWIDILVLTSVSPASFVARADLLEWGALGTVARWMRVVPIERERLRALPEIVDRVTGRLVTGERVALFPEGTTWCGRATGGFRPALFESAVRAECPVQPIGVRYLDSDGALTTEPAFVGEETIGPAMRRLTGAKGTVAQVVLAPLEWPGSDRFDLAKRCERAVRRAVGTDETVPAVTVRAPSPA